MGAINLVIWVLGVGCVISSILGAVLLHENVSKWWLLVTFAIGPVIICLSPRDISSSTFWLYIVAGFLTIFFIFLAPKRRDRVFMLGSNFGIPTHPPSVPEPKQGLPEASILGPLIKAIKENRENVDSPPPGFWSAIFPNPMSLGHEHRLKINFPSLKEDIQDNIDWEREMVIPSVKNGEVILLITPIAQSFDIQPDKREIIIQTGRRLTTDFFVTPTKLGKHPLRLEIYIGRAQLGWLQETIRVRINIQKLLPMTVTFIGVIATILGILKTLKIIG